MLRLRCRSVVQTKADWEFELRLSLRPRLLLRVRRRLGVQTKAAAEAKAQIGDWKLKLRRRLGVQTKTKAMAMIKVHLFLTLLLKMQECLRQLIFTRLVLPEAASTARSPYLTPDSLPSTPYYSISCHYRSS